MLRVCLCLCAAAGLAGVTLFGWLNVLPLVAVHYVFAISVTLALICVLILVLVLGGKLARWALFLDAPKTRHATR